MGKFSAAVDSNFSQSMDAENISAADVIGGDLEVTFKQNRSFELHIGRDTYLFSGQETKKFSKKLLSHKDWTPVIAEYFTVKEVA